jgi:hypothetical protein
LSCIIDNTVNAIKKEHKMDKIMDKIIKENSSFASIDLIKSISEQDDMFSVYKEFENIPEINNAIVDGILYFNVAKNNITDKVISFLDIENKSTYRETLKIELLELLVWLRIIERKYFLYIEMLENEFLKELN